eukprot:3940651-Rhodomonas_salina.10
MQQHTRGRGYLSVVDVPTHRRRKSSQILFLAAEYPMSVPDFAGAFQSFTASCQNRTSHRECVAPRLSTYLLLSIDRSGPD